MTSWDPPGTTADDLLAEPGDQPPPEPTQPEPTQPEPTPPSAPTAETPPEAPQLPAGGGLAWRDWTPPASGAVDAVRYGPDVATEAELKLLGNVEGKRVLELGCGTGHNAIALARQGGRVIGVDPSDDDLGVARRRCEAAEVRVELRHGDLADLAFLRADTVDAALSTWALARVTDLSRVFRQIHRVLRPEAPLVLSLPHPAFAMVADRGAAPAVVRSYFDRSPLGDSGMGSVQHHTLGELFMALVRTNFRVDVIAEPEPPGGGPRSEVWTEAARLVPRTLVLRARKEGS